MSLARAHERGFRPLARLDCGWIGEGEFSHPPEVCAPVRYSPSNFSWKKTSPAACATQAASSSATTAAFMARGRQGRVAWKSRERKSLSGFWNVGGVAVGRCSPLSWCLTCWGRRRACAKVKKCEGARLTGRAQREGGGGVGGGGGCAEAPEPPHRHVLLSLPSQLLCLNSLSENQLSVTAIKVTGAMSGAR